MLLYCPCPYSVIFFLHFSICIYFLKQTIRHLDTAECFIVGRARGHQDGSFSPRAVPARRESPQGRKRHVSSSSALSRSFSRSCTPPEFWLWKPAASTATVMRPVESHHKLEPQKIKNKHYKRSPMECIVPLSLGSFTVIQLEKS